MPTTRTPFEDFLVETIASRYNCDHELATHIVDTYLPVIRELDDLNDGVRVQADLYYQAYNDGRDPQKWLRHIYQTNNKYGVPNKTEPVQSTVPASRKTVNDIPRYTRTIPGLGAFQVSEHKRAGQIIGRPAANRRMALSANSKEAAISAAKFLPTVKGSQSIVRTKEGAILGVTVLGSPRKIKTSESVPKASNKSSKPYRGARKSSR